MLILFHYYYYYFLTYTSMFTSGTLSTVIVIALFLHILWVAGFTPTHIVLP